MRLDGRANDELRPVVITPRYLDQNPASVLVQMGRTWVLCTASVADDVPFWLRNQVQGWVTAEYGLLPAATHVRTPREARQGRIRGRTHEIQRMIGRSLRAALDLRKLGERTITIDCDVIQADGGTRTAAVTGGYVALALALNALVESGAVHRNVWSAPVAAVSVGIVQGESVLDLSYEEDSRAEVDLNVVMNARARFVEVQGTAEGQPFERARMDELLDLAQKGINELLAVQKQVLAG
ncbi:MAG: ribonuclease PH [Anaerolineales bacterium]|nr:MAG: ribonuclease PH [Anaerolineales bacterium]